ncbi:DUF3696 domain-containing protein [Chryseobacterium sp. SN22]|uniref:DUF3696 domain-containing protein n=1 Tax=Chryseobacterium sp. SN22 TaxID=2606431 RepID=UPI0011EF457E|nr:DUF3696 domain-containing protein [Chryseobacterium sp. SN22]KAA0126416.1 DUF3696 domain-containing protein [Chryseobacterium sp. SN22]
MKLKKIEPQVCKIYHKNDDLVTFIGVANDLEFTDFRVQIKDAQVEGYYAEFTVNGETKVLNIDKDGRCPNWQQGMFDQNLDNLWLLL